MFDNKNFEKLGEDIYVFHNFASDDVCDLICADAKLLKDEDWRLLPFERYASTIKVSSNLENLRNTIYSILEDGLYLGEGLAIQKMMRGSYFLPHSDDYEFANVIKAADAYIEGEEFDLVKNNAFGVVVYLNDFEGGEIEYVDQNIKYKPVKGDLLVHGAHDNCKHQVNEVLSEIRYVYSTNIFNMVKVPKGYLNENGDLNVS